MSQVQKIIKYLALAFAIFLIFSIAYGIMSGFTFIVDSFSDDDEVTVTDTLDELDVDINDISNMDIDFSFANLTIKQGNEFNIESNYKNISSGRKGNTLYIKENSHFNFSKKDKNAEVIITIPEEVILNNIEIETGIGKIKIDGLNTYDLSCNFGTGNSEISNLNVINYAEFDGGAGEILITSSSISNLDMDMGVGKVVMEAKLIGNNEINAGVGEVKLTLLGSTNDYKIKVDKGVGSVKIDNQEISDDTYYGNGINAIEIDGGVGSIDIYYDDEN